MKKALTIYIDDDTQLRYLCGTFITEKPTGANSVTMVNETIPNDAAGIYLPFKKTGSGTQWIREEQ